MFKICIHQVQRTPNKTNFSRDSHVIRGTFVRILRPTVIDPNKAFSERNNLMRQFWNMTSWNAQKPLYIVERLTEQELFFRKQAVAIITQQTVLYRTKIYTWSKPWQTNNIQETVRKAGTSPIATNSCRKSRIRPGLRIHNQPQLARIRRTLGLGIGTIKMYLPSIHHTQNLEKISIGCA
jgi:hypothetical protein